MCEGGELRGKGVFVLEKAAIAISGAINEQVCSRDEKTREQLLRLILIEIFISWIGRVSILKGVAIRRIARSDRVNDRGRRNIFNDWGGSWIGDGETPVLYSSLGNARSDSAIEFIGEETGIHCIACKIVRMQSYL